MGYAVHRVKMRRHEAALVRERPSRPLTAVELAAKQAEDRKQELARLEKSLRRYKFGTRKGKDKQETCSICMDEF